MDPDTGFIHFAQRSWLDLELVKDDFYLNLLLSVTICLGWSSLMLDVFLAWCKSHDWRIYNWGPLSKIVDWFVDEDGEMGFWKRAVLLEGISSFKLNEWNIDKRESQSQNPEIQGDYGSSTIDTGSDTMDSGSSFLDSRSSTSDSGSET